MMKAVRFLSLATLTTMGWLLDSGMAMPSLSSSFPSSLSCKDDGSSSFFGISGTTSRRATRSTTTKESLLNLRGGAVLEPETLQEVESILLKAGSEQKLVVIDFSATWCGPCKMIAPLFKELSDMIPEVVFLKIDVDDNPETAAKYNVSAMPTFVFIRGGEVVDRLMGASPTRLQELIDELK